MARSSLDIRQTVYSETTDHGDEESAINSTGAPSSTTPTITMAMNQQLPHRHQLYDQYVEFQNNDEGKSLDPSLTLAFPPLPLSFQQNFTLSMDPYTTDVFSPQLAGGGE